MVKGQGGSHRKSRCKIGHKTGSTWQGLEGGLAQRACGNKEVTQKK
jgi:hypothetical protein